MIFLEVQNKQDLPVFLLLLNSYTLMTKRTNKKWSLKIHIHTHTKLPAAAIKWNTIWKLQCKKVIFAHAI